MSELKIKQSSPSPSNEKLDDKGIENETQEIPAESEKPKIKLNLKALSQNKNPSPTEEAPEGNPQSEVIQDEVSDTSNPPVLTEQETVEEVVPKEDESSKTQKINLWNIKATQKPGEQEQESKQEPTPTNDTEVNMQEKESSQTQKTKNPLAQDEESEEKKGKIFWNYESHFEKKSQSFIDAIRNFKTSPKTRIWLVIFLITITFTGIMGLMYIAPEKHGLQAYKWSIMQIYNVFMREDSPTTQSPPTQVITPIQEPALPVKEEVIEQQIIEEKKKKVKDFLLENYWK